MLLLWGMNCFRITSLTRVAPREEGGGEEVQAAAMMRTMESMMVVLAEATNLPTTILLGEQMAEGNQEYRGREGQHLWQRLQRWQGWQGVLEVWGG